MSFHGIQLEDAFFPFFWELCWDIIQSFFLRFKKNCRAFTEEHIEGDGQEENNHEVLLKCHGAAEHGGEGWNMYDFKVAFLRGEIGH